MFWAHDNRTYSRLEAFYGRDEAGKWGHFATSPPYNCRRDHPLSETLIIRETMPTFQQAQWTISGILLFTMQVLCVSCIICVDIVMFSMWQLSFINITWLERTVNIPGELKIRRSVTQALTLLLETNLCRKLLKRWTHVESTVWMSIVLFQSGNPYDLYPLPQSAKQALSLEVVMPCKAVQLKDWRQLYSWTNQKVEKLSCFIQAN